MIIVPNIDQAVLLASALGEEPVYSEEEAQFLGAQAPHQFSKVSLERYRESEQLRYELLSIIFKKIVTLDATVQNAQDLSMTAANKAESLNEVLIVLGIPKVESGVDFLATLWDVKMKGLQALEALATGFNAVDSYFERNAIAVPERFRSVRESILEYYHDVFSNVPMFLYGSSLKNENPTDYDVRAFVTGMAVNYYYLMHGKGASINGKKIELSIVPIQYLVPFAIAEYHNQFSERNSIMLYGDLKFPILKQGHIDKGIIVDLATNLIDLRESLTQDGFAKTEILKRFMSIIKRPRFAAELVSYTTGFTVPSPLTPRYESLPPVEQRIGDLVQANLQMNTLLKFVSG